VRVWTWRQKEQALVRIATGGPLWVKSVAFCNRRPRLDFRYAPLADKLERHCNMSRWAKMRHPPAGMQKRSFWDANPFHSLSPTTRRSIRSIISERSSSAALMAAIVCRNVPTFDPRDTMPPSTAAIDPMAAT
jgi:hypothetical protein